MHPFLDVAKLSDEEILSKLGKAYSFLNYQTMLGHNDTVMSIKEVIQSLEDERQRRMAKLVDDEAKRRNPNDLKPIELGKIDEEGK